MEKRIQSIDIVRGAVMVLMAIDHVRVYSGMPAGGATVGIFFTRWVTHFCAPAFCFLAGTSAYLYGRKLSKGELSRHLLIRGLILVVLELTVIRFAWTFNFDYAHVILAGVIWMLGWCMALLAGLVQLPTKAVGIIGLCIIVFQRAFSFPAAGPIWLFIYPSKAKPWEAISILYVLVPWIGVMAAGYAFGAIITRDDRRRLCLIIGCAAIALFLIAAPFFLRSDARPLIFRLLDQQKYPASPLFLLMTLGPTIACLALVDGVHAEVLAVFGRVPMFYYLLHIPTIHVAALIVGLLRDGQVHSAWYAYAPFASVPVGERWSLPLLYLVWALVIVVLYWPCRWYATRRRGWLRYI